MARRRSRIGAIGTATIEKVDAKGLGVGTYRERPVRVPVTLPGEQVRFRIVQQKRREFRGQLLDLFSPDAARIKPGCQHFYDCGGCALQHLSINDQVALKEERLRTHFAQTGLVLPTLAPPIQGPQWGYRRSARMGVRYVAGKGGALVGFREKASNRVAVLSRCETLIPAVGTLLAPLRALISSLGCRRTVPQIEMIGADGATALTLRHLEPLDDADRRALLAFGREHRIHWLLQSGGPDSVVPLAGQSPLDLHYMHHAFALKMVFHAADFVQVNGIVNERLVEQAIAWLAPRPDDRILDAFCGIGNFSLPLATRAGTVVGIEGAPALVKRAAYNAELNGLANVQFDVVDLYQSGGAARCLAERWSAVLVDPPRSGALEFVESMVAPYPERLLYVACEPSTLARDAAILVQRHGYVIVKAGIADMFPHTNHVESMVLFTRTPSRCGHAA